MRALGAKSSSRSSRVILSVSNIDCLIEELPVMRGGRTVHRKVPEPPNEFARRSHGNSVDRETLRTEESFEGSSRPRKG